MVRKIFVLLLITFVSVFSQNIKVKSYTDTTDYNVGDYIKYTISIEHNKNTSVTKPVLKDTSLKLDIIRSDSPVEKEDNGKIVTEFSYILSGYDSIETAIPSFPIRYKQVNEGEKLIYTAPVNVRVHTLKVNTQEDIKDIKDPLTIPLDWKIILLWILIILLLAAVIYYLYNKYFRNRKTEAPAPKKIIIPADIEALSSLDNLEKKQLWQKGQVKEYHSEITEIIRLYFEKRFNLPALELTTSEVNTQLRLKSGATKIIDLTNDFLSNADLVKFAKYQPDFNLNEEMMKQAKEIIERTRPGKVMEESNVQ